MKHFWFSRNRSSLATRIGLLVVLAMVLTLFPSAMAGAEKAVPPTANPKQLQSNKAAMAPDGITPVPMGAIIDNGTVQLGVNYAGHLNVDGGTPSSGTGTPWVGLRYMATNAEATAPGCLCEGWGVGDAISGFSGWASIDNGGIVNVTQLSYGQGVDGGGAGWATCVVQVGNTFSVTHDYHASASPYLYEATVTIENISPADTDVRYRRVMDWDVEPTAFNEYVTIYTGGATKVLYSSDNGFASSDPLAGPSYILFEGEAVDSGPTDHGALFDFGFGLVPPGDEVTFQIYYGAAGTETESLAALAAVSAEVYSLGQPSTPDGPTLGTPNTFIFGFKGVGGTPVGARGVYGYIFLDTNGNGVRDLDEQTGIQVPVMLKQGATTVGSVWSYAPGGWYDFGPYDPGDYCVQAAIPPEYVLTSANPVCFTLDQEKGINIGVRLGKATIGDFVWYDDNADGVQNPGELGIGNVTVALWSGAGGVPGSILQTATTDANGKYLFKVVPGAYFVQVTDANGVLTGLTLTAGPQSKPNPAGPISVVDGSAYLDADFGYGLVCATGRGGLSGHVWLDANGDKVLGGSEAGIPGVTVCAQPLSYLATRCTSTNNLGRVPDVPAEGHVPGGAGQGVGAPGRADRDHEGVPAAGGDQAGNARRGQLRL